MSDLLDNLDLETHQLHLPGTSAWQKLVDRCRNDLERSGMCDLEGLLRPVAAAETARLLAPRMETEAFAHRRRHNIYFQPTVEGLQPGHPALKQVETSNLTLCADKLKGSPVIALYEWEPLHRFLAAIMGKPELHPMADPLARVNVMSYPAGHSLNWHFDRAEFTITLLLQRPERGGQFEYRTNLRSADNPNHEGVARLLSGQDRAVESLSLSPGTLNVFRGINTPHRVTEVEGGTSRMVAVFSYFDRPGVRFTSEEQMGFYGRSA